MGIMDLVNKKLNLFESVTLKSRGIVSVVIPKEGLVRNNLAKLSFGITQTRKENRENSIL